MEYWGPLSEPPVYNQQKEVQKGLQPVRSFIKDAVWIQQWSGEAGAECDSSTMQALQNQSQITLGTPTKFLAHIICHHPVLKEVKQVKCPAAD